MKNNKGITLVSLISSILLIIILAATTIVTSMNAYNQMQFEGAKAELEEMQKLVDELASDYQVYLKQASDSENATYVDFFTTRYNNNTFASKTITSSEVASNSKVKSLIAEFSINSSAEKPSAFYFTEDDLVKFFGLKGIEPIVVDFSTRTVYSVDGIKDSNDKNTVYYTPSQWGAKKVKEEPQEELLGIDTIVKAASKDNIYEINIIFEGILSTNITEVYYAEENSTSYIKADGFRDITTSSDAETVIRATIKIDATKKYKFKLVDSAKNVYVSSAAQKF